MYIDERQKEVAIQLVETTDYMLGVKSNREAQTEALERAANLSLIFHGLRQVYYEYPELRLPKGQKVI